MDIGLAMHDIFKEYYGLLSYSIKKTVLGYEPLDQSVELPKEADRKTAIKVSFNNKSWIRVYRIRDEVEWY